MNPKTPNRKTKAPAARTAAKPAATAVAARKPPATSPVSTKVRKLPAANRVKTTPRSASVASPIPATLAGKNKQARLISLLQAKSGATIDQMMTLTGWQAHTVRGTISGVLRKKLGLSVTLATGANGARIYRIAA